MRSIFLIAANILKITFRKTGSIILVIFLPILALVISLPLNSSSTQQAVKMGVYYNDSGTLAKDMIGSLEKTGRFITVPVTEKEISDKITAGKLDCVLKIPSGFEEGIYSRNPKEIEVVSIKGAPVTAWVEGYVNYYVKNLMDISEAANGNTAIFNKMYNGYKNGKLVLSVSKLQDETKGKGITTMATGFLIMFMMLSASFTASLIIKEKTNRTYFRIYAAPVPSSVYIAGNILANVAIVLIQILIIIAGTKIIGINTFIPDIELLIVLLCMGTVAIALGILVVSFSKSSPQVSTLTTLIITPTCMIGGCFLPLSMMPDVLRKIANFMPQKWAVEALAKLQSGVSFSGVLLNIIIDLAFALAFFLIAAYRFKIDNDVRNFV